MKSDLIRAEGGWTWRSLGAALMLVTATGGSKVVLTGDRCGAIVTRDGSGRLRPINKTDDVALLIAAAPDLLAALKLPLLSEIASTLRMAAQLTTDETVSGLVRERSAAFEAFTQIAEAAIAKAEGRP